MALTYYEKTEFTEHTDEFVERTIRNDDKYSMLLLKILALSVRNSDTLANDWDESIFEDPQKMKEKLAQLLIHAAKEAFTMSNQKSASSLYDLPRPSVELRGYTTKDLSKFFGVSQTTINKWVTQKRFDGIARNYQGENLYFPPSTLFTSPNGNQYLINDIVAEYEVKQTSTASSFKAEIDNAKEQIAYYTAKYKASYEDTFGITQDQRTPQEEIDADTWKFYLEKMDVSRDSS